MPGRTKAAVEDLKFLLADLPFTDLGKPIHPTNVLLRLRAMEPGASKSPF